MTTYYSTQKSGLKNDYEGEPYLFRISISKLYIQFISTSFPTTSAVVSSENITIVNDELIIYFTIMAQFLFLI